MGEPPKMTKEASTIEHNRINQSAKKGMGQKAFDWQGRGEEKWKNERKVVVFVVCFVFIFNEWKPDVFQLNEIIFKVGLKWGGETGTKITKGRDQYKILKIDTKHNILIEA